MKRRENRAKVKSAMQTERRFMDASKGFFREDSFLDSLMITISYLYHGREYIKYLFKINLDTGGFFFQKRSQGSGN